MAGSDSRTDFGSTGLYHKRWHRLSKLSLACLFCFLSGSGLYLATRKAPSTETEVASTSPAESETIKDPKIVPASGILPPAPVAVVDRPQTISLPPVEILPVPGMETPPAKTARETPKPAPVDAPVLPPPTPVAAAPSLLPPPAPATPPVPQLKVEMPKGEIPTPAVPRVELPSPTVAKVELPSPSLPQLDAPKIDTAKKDTPKAPEIPAITLNTQKVELPSPAVPKLELPSPSLPKLDAPRTDAAKLVVPLPDVTRAEVPKITLPSPAVPKVELPSPTLPKLDVPRIDTVKKDTPKAPEIPAITLNTPKIEMPSPAVPKVELPSPTIPKLEVTKKDDPKAPEIPAITLNTPKIDVPVPTIPKVEAVKADTAKLSIPLPELPLPTVPKVELPSPSDPNKDAVKPELPKVAVSVPELPKPEKAKSSPIAIPLPEVPLVAVPKVELPKPELPSLEVPKLATTQPVSPKKDLMPLTIPVPEVDPKPAEVARPALSAKSVQSPPPVELPLPDLRLQSLEAGNNVKKPVASDATTKPVQAVPVSVETTPRDINMKTTVRNLTMSAVLGTAVAMSPAPLPAQDKTKEAEKAEKTADKTAPVAITKDDIDNLRKDLASLKGLLEGKTDRGISSDGLVQRVDRMEKLLEDINTRIAKLEATKLTAGSSPASGGNNASSTPANNATMGTVSVVNMYPTEISIVINEKSYRVDPNEKKNVMVPAGNFKYLLLGGPGKEINRDIKTGETVTLWVK